MLGTRANRAPRTRHAAVARFLEDTQTFADPLDYSAELTVAGELSEPQSLFPMLSCSLFGEGDQPSCAGWLLEGLVTSTFYSTSSKFAPSKILQI